MDTWKEAKANALKKYIEKTCASLGFSVDVTFQKKGRHLVSIRNGALRISCNETMSQTERYIETMISRMHSCSLVCRQEVKKIWKSKLDTTFLMNPLDCRELMRMYIVDNNEQALMYCWLHDDERFDDADEYRQKIYDKYMDNLFE